MHKTYATSDDADQKFSEKKKDRDDEGNNEDEVWKQHLQAYKLQVLDDGEHRMVKWVEKGWGTSITKMVYKCQKREGAPRGMECGSEIHSTTQYNVFCVFRQSAAEGHSSCAGMKEMERA